MQVPWQIVPIFLVGGLIGYGFPRRRPLVVALAIALIVSVFAALAHGAGWLGVAVLIGVPFLVAAVAGATLRQRYSRPRTSKALQPKS